MLQMGNVGKIIKVRPEYVLPGGEIEVLAEDFRPERGEAFACLVDSQPCRITASSSHRVIANVPSSIKEYRHAKLQLSVGAAESEIVSDSQQLHVAGLKADEMHIVANPAVDPNDDSIITTRSGARGQHLENTIYRIETGGYIDELPDPILNPTGIAFGPDGKMYVTNRADGEVWVVNINGNNSIHASGLGIATGLAFDADGVMYVGDRSGTIFRINGYDDAQVFASLEPSVAAYHIAFGTDRKLYVSAPGLSSSDAIYAIDRKGDVTTFFRGLGRPQGLAFDAEGNLYVAACYRGRHGIVRISPDAESAELFVSGNNIVGLCFTRSGDMILATNDSVYSLPVGIKGTLL
ncbi:MAG: SMP-30/gluconolactonase/LRE family protein [Pyrinomonadaceae bacterium]